MGGNKIVIIFRQSGHTENLQSEVENLRRLETLATEQWKKSRRKKNPQISFGNITRFFSPFTKSSMLKVGGAAHRRTESLLVPSATNESLEKVNSAIPNLTTTPSLEINPPFKKGHRRAKSDGHNITTILTPSEESCDSNPPSRESSITPSAHDGEADDDRWSISSMPSGSTPSPTPTPIFEISVTVEIESGKMYFYHQLYDGDSAQ